MGRLTLLKHLLLSWLFISKSRLHYLGSLNFYVRDKQFLKTDRRGSSGNFTVHIASENGTFEDFLPVTRQEFYKYDIDQFYGKRGVVALTSRDGVIKTSAVTDEEGAIRDVARRSLFAAILTSVLLAIALAGLVFSFVFIGRFINALVF